MSDLARAAGDEHEVSHLSFADLRGDVLPDSGFRLKHNELSVDVDAIIVRSMPPGSLEQIVFRMDLLHRAEAAGITVLNDPRSLECAIDKFLSSAKIQAAGVPMPATIACQTVNEAMAAFEQLGGDVVVKPLFGGEGRGITRVSDPDLALRAFKMLQQLGAVIYLQRFVQHQGWDIRILFVGERLFAIKRIGKDDWRTNIGRGGKAEPVEVEDRWVELARRSVQAVGATLAGVDIVVDQDQQPFVLEVNAVPGWRALNRALNVDTASEVIRHLESIVS